MPTSARWIEDEVPFPRTMVDSITPATDDALRDSRRRTRSASKIAGPCSAKRSCQWVIEDSTARTAARIGQRRRDGHDDVAGFERAKLRLLNGAHSSLAYLGLAARL